MSPRLILPKSFYARNEQTSKKIDISRHSVSLHINGDSNSESELEWHIQNPNSMEICYKS